MTCTLSLSFSRQVTASIVRLVMIQYPLVYLGLLFRLKRKQTSDMVPRATLSPTPSLQGLLLVSVRLSPIFSLSLCEAADAL